MKKILLLISLLLLFPLISAVQINMNSNFSQGQTLIAEVSGNFINQIQNQNILLYSGYSRVSFIPTVQEIGGNFYIYGQLIGRSPGNYSLDLTGLSYMVGNQISHKDIIQNFTITNSTADFSVNPGFIQTDQNFSINVDDLSANSITINYYLGNLTSSDSSIGNFFSSLFGGTSATSQEESITLNSGSITSVYFNITTSDQDQFIYAVLSTNNTQYQIPVFIPAVSLSIENSTNMTTNLTNTTNESSLNISNTSSIILQIQPSEANVSLSTNASTYRYIYIYNLGQQNLTNISIFVSNNLIPYVSVQNQTLYLFNNSSASDQININSSSTEGVINGQIIVMSGNLTSYLNLSLNISNEYIPSQQTTNDTSQFQTCNQLNGTICNSNETCSGQIQDALDGTCCLAICKQQTQNNSTGTIIGIVLVLIIS